jgi:hypothetical protein
MTSRRNHDLAHAQGMIVELDRSWRVAPTCGIDAHGIYSLVEAEPGPCRTGILAPSLTKDDVLQAFQQRRIYSTRDLDLRLSYKANGLWMGSVIGEPDAVAFDIDVSDPDTANPADQIMKIDIVTEHGQVVASQTFGSHSVRWNPTLPAKGKKYFLVRVYNGERAEPTAYAAPVWRE